MIEIDKCPLCGKKLKKVYEGLVCKNHLCKLYFKLGKGWVCLRESMTKEEQIINDMWNTDSRIRFAKEWVEVKSIILKRDNYICQFCNYNLSDDFYRKNGLNVHHIIYSSKDSSLYLDPDNLITVCNSCHKLLHSADKYKYV